MSTRAIDHKPAEIDGKYMYKLIKNTAKVISTWEINDNHKKYMINLVVPFILSTSIALGKYAHNPKISLSISVFENGAVNNLHSSYLWITK